MVFFRKQIETCLSEMGIKEEFYGMVLWATMLSIRCVRKEIKTTLPLSMSEQPWWWRVGSGWQAHSAFPTPPNWENRAGLGVCWKIPTLGWGRSWLDNTLELWAQNCIGLGLRVWQFSFHNDKEQKQSPVLPERGVISSCRHWPCTSQPPIFPAHRTPVRSGWQCAQPFPPCGVLSVTTWHGSGHWGRGKSTDGKWGGGLWERPPFSTETKMLEESFLV